MNVKFEKLLKQQTFWYATLHVELSFILTCNLTIKISTGIPRSSPKLPQQFTKIMKHLQIMTPVRGSQWG